MKQIKLYLVNWYQCRRADEQGQRWMLDIPTDNIDYKSEVVTEAYFQLPDGIEVREFYGVKYFAKNGEECRLITEKDGSVSLVGDRIYKLTRL